MNKYIKYNDLTKEQKEMVDSDDWHVRFAVAEQGYGLDKLVDDESYLVRASVAEQGYGLDVLINDEDWDVRDAVKNYLIAYDYKDINDWIEKNPVKCALSENMQDIDLDEEVDDLEL